MMSEVLVYGVGGSLVLVAVTWLLCRFALKSPAARNTVWRMALLLLWLLPAAVMLRLLLPVEPVTISVPIAFAPDMPMAAPAEAPEPLAHATVSSPWWAAMDPLKALPWLWAAGCLIGALVLARDVISACGALRRAQYADDGGVGPDGVPQFLQIHLPRLVHADESHLVAVPTFQFAAEAVHRGMLHLGGDDVFLLGISAQGPHHGQVVTLGSAAGERDFRNAGPQSRREFFACFVQNFFRPPAGEM